MIFEHSIEKRLIAMILASIGGIFLLVSVTSFFYLESEKHRWEEQQVGRIKVIVENLVVNQFDSLRGLGVNYALADDSYLYVEDANLDFVLRKMQSSSLKFTDLSAVLLTDRDGIFIPGVSRLEYGNEQLLFNLLQEANPTVHPQRPDSGIAYIEDQSFIYVRLPISNTDGSAPHNGHAYMVRALNANMINKMSDDIGHEFALKKIDKFKPTQRVSFQQGWQTDVTNIQHYDGRVKATYSVSTSYGDPLDFSVSFDLKLDQLSSAMLWVLPQLLGIAFLSFALVYIVRKQFTRPLSDLTAQLQVSKSSSLSEQPLRENRHDELGILAKNINTLYHQAYSQHQFSSLLLSSIGEAIITVQPNGCISFANTAATHWLDVEAELLHKRHLAYLLSAVDQGVQSVERWLYTVLKLQQDLEICTSLRTCANPEIVQPVQVFGHPLLTSKGDSEGAVFIIRLGKRPA